MRLWLKKHAAILGCVLAIFLVAFLFAFRFDTQTVSVGHDYFFNLGNVFATQVALGSEHLSPSSLFISPVVFNNLGYGLRIFYPPLSHLTPAVFNVIFSKIGFTSTVLAMRAFDFFIIFMSGTVMFYVSRALLKKRNCLALLAAVIYQTSSFFLGEFYIRSGYGEAICYIFLPLLVLALVEFYRERYRHFYLLFVLGFLGIIYSHLITTFYSALVISLILFFTLPWWWKKARSWLTLILAAVSLLFLSLPFYLPFLVNYSSGLYIINTMSEVANPALSVIAPWRFLPIISFIKGSTNLPFNLDFGFNLVVLILLLIGIFNYQKIKAKLEFLPKYFLLSSYVLVALGLILSVWAWPWELVPSVMRFIQFPWRLYIFVTVVVSILAVLPLLLMKKKIAKIGSVILIIILVASSFIFSVHRREELKNIDLTVTTSWFALGVDKEYLPIVAKDKVEWLVNGEGRGREVVVLATETPATLSGVATPSAKIVVDDTPYLEVEITGNDGRATVELPRLYYLGYAAKWLNKNSSQEEKLEIAESANGLIQVTVEGEGKLVVDYVGVRGFKLTLFLALLTLLVNFAVLVWLGKRDNAASRN